jgi:hypothetical protein
MGASSPPAAASRQRHWQSALIGLLLVTFVSAWAAAWIVVRDRVAAQDDYYLGAAQVDLTPLPPWIRSNVKAEVLRDASLDRPLSILDDGLVRRIYEAFPLHPWIARVERVSKRYPARVIVEVAYRRPICMVEVHIDKLARGVHPVDVESVLLPTADFSSVDAARFPLLRGIDTQPGPAGAPWGDQRVLDGCRLAAALAEVWMELQLASLAPLPRAEDAWNEPFRYELLTRSQTRIVWGLPPSDSPADKALVEAKIERLRQSLQSPGGRADESSSDSPPPFGQTRLGALTARETPRVIHLEGLDASPPQPAQ